MIQSPSLESRVHAFAELGQVMGYAAEYYTSKESGFANHYPELYDSLQIANQQNPWFTPVNIAFALNAWKQTLTEESISKWISDYEPIFQNIESRKA